MFVSVNAQSFSGSVTGRILDPQQGAVANATITLKNTATGAERRDVSDKEGNYTFVSVPPGKYTVRAEAPGFTAGNVPVEVSVASSLRADVSLAIQGAQEIITVAATGESGVAVQTEQATLGTNITQQQVMDLPSITRDPYDFIALSAGATPTMDGRSVGLAVNGQRTSSGTFILDGGENNDTFVAGVGQRVPMDAVQEYKIQTNNYTAEYGRSAGFIANVVTRSGSNQFHGAAYWYNRNSALAANSFQNNSVGVTRGKFNRNQFGGRLGGPIIKDKVNFFGSFEPILVRSNDTSLFWVPTTQLLALSSPGTRGLLSKFPAPTSGVLSTQNQTICPFGVTCDEETGAGLVTIPAFARVGIQAPVDAGAGSPQDTYLATGRIDYNISEKTQVFGRYAFEDSNIPVLFNVNAYSSSLYQPQVQRNNNILLNVTRTWSGSLVTESRITYNRISGPTNPVIPNKGAMPAFTVDGSVLDLPQGASSFGGPQNVYQFMQTVNWIKGNHNLKFGGQYVHLRDNRTFGAYETAEARFGDLQAFVDGIVSAYTIAIDPKGAYPGQTVTGPITAPSFTRHFRYNEPALFVQDTWKVTPKLTLTPGLRWEYFGVLHSPEHEKQLDANFYYGTGSTIYERIKNGKFMRTIDAPGDYKGHFYLPRYKDFGPRFGVAYDLFGDGKTSIRGGFGIFYDRNFGNVLFNAIQNPPNYGTVRLTDVKASAAMVDNQYSPFGSGTVTLRGTSARHLDQDMKNAYTRSWNASIEHEFARRYVVGMTYVGSQGKRLYSLNNINRAGSEQFLRPSCIAADDCGRLNTNASSINTRGNLGESKYHGLQFNVNSRRIDKIGVMFGANYTYSRSKDNSSSFFADDGVANPIGFGFLEAYNPNSDWGYSDFDATHRVTANFVWELPLARNSSNALAKHLLKGWQISGLMAFQTGQPFGVFDSGVGDYSVESPRVTLKGKMPSTLNKLVPDSDTANTWLYLPLDAFGPGTSVNGPFTGTINRNIFRRPGNHFQNIAFMKNWSLNNDTLKVQFRSELYNIFNHANLLVNGGSNDIANTSSFIPTPKGDSVSGVTVRRGNTNGQFGPRQIVMALRFEF